MSKWSKSTNEVFRSPVEEVIMGHIQKIQDANKLKDKEEVYDFLIQNWYMFDAHWLAIVRHMKESGRFQ